MSRGSCAFLLLLAACGSHAPGAPDSSPDGTDTSIDAPATAASNRDRLLATYLGYLKAHPGPKSNGLDGAQLAGVCDLWSKLQPSARAVFLTLTARLEGSILGADQRSMLDHVTTLYRVVGGGNATQTDPGTCGGGENNRVFVSIDPALHAAQVAAFAHQGATPHDITDVKPGGFWRNSHDLGGPHTPFDQSDETNDDVPSGQTQYFKDPASAKALAPLGRVDVMDLVDPYALEFDQDYDCVHNSNPSCAYTLYGSLCTPKMSVLGVDLYGASYGVIDLAWLPAGCEPS